MTQISGLTVIFFHEFYLFQKIFFLKKKKRGEKKILLQNFDWEKEKKQVIRNLI
jgi:hypothetical protein